MDAKKPKPFVKWAGGKKQLITELQKHYPAELGKSIRKYAEPFVGGGAVLFDILSQYILDEIFICDTNAELINTYIILRDHPDDLIALLAQYQAEYLPLDNQLRKAYFYEKRARYNTLQQADQLKIELAALFIFLNRTCFNGLYRVNRTGAYNVPIGSYTSPLICDEENLRMVSSALSKVTITQGDYRLSNDFIDSGTFVYFDPPYRPLNATANFTAYNKIIFDDKAQEALANYIQQLSDRGAYIVISNSDPKNTNPSDEFFEMLYPNMKILRVSASRMINSNAKARGKITELLIRNK